MRHKRTTGSSRRPAVPPIPAAYRINRFLSMCGISSRRKAEELVRAGKVEVNRKVVTELATKVDPSRDTVFVDGKRAVPTRGYLYLVLNKPRDAITTLSDEKGRTTVMSMVRTKQRVYPVGRLDRNTTGVLLFTNDGQFAHRLMHPRYEIPKTYRVTCSAPLSTGHLEALRRGVELEDGRTAPTDIYVIPGGRRREIGVVIHEGRNRQVRRMFESLGYEVQKLDRVAYGPVTKEGLARGATRSLTRQEVRALKTMAGYSDEEQWRDE
ncbi:MAG: pseudouridine synthase [Bacteroidota bacterium]